MPRIKSLLIGTILFSSGNALNLDPTNADSIKSAAKSVAKNLNSFYNGTSPGEVPGIFGSPLYWWSSGAIWESLIEYWYLTGDDTYNSEVQQSLLFQTGPGNDFMPANQTKSEGNDDQGIWGSAALTAVELGFPTGPGNSTPWQDLAVNVFNDQAARWDTGTCNGGLRWQIFSFNAGYSYKNSIANALFFQLAARLSHSTGNQTYSDWAEKVYTWIEQVGLLSNGAIYDGSDTTTNCSQINHIQWTANAGIFLHGSAVMYNSTSSSTWSSRISTILNETQSIFFKDGIMIEVACETTGKCDTDQTFFKGLLARDLARTAQWAPFTASVILPLLQSSAKAAASTCDDSGANCKFVWTPNGNTSSSSPVSEQFSALEVIQANLVPLSKVPTGNGSSPSNGTSGGSAPKKSDAFLARISTGLLFIIAVFTILIVY